MVLEAEKNPMPTMAPNRHPGRRMRRQRQRGEPRKTITRLPPIAIHLPRIQQAVQRAEGEHAKLVGDDGGEQHVCRPAIELMPCTSRRKRGRPTGPCTVKVQA